MKIAKRLLHQIQFAKEQEVRSVVNINLLLRGSRQDQTDCHWIPITIIIPPSRTSNDSAPPLQRLALPISRVVLV